MQAAGFVLVGGESSRMGQNKARLPLNSQPLVESIAWIVAQVCETVTLVGKPECFSDLSFDCLADLRPGCGPLAGLETALASSRAEFNVITGCDMPDLEDRWLMDLLTVCQRSGALCAIARDEAGTRHPLCGVYRSACLPFISAALDAGRWRLLDLVEELKAVEMPVNAIIANLNTPRQWADWQAAHCA